MRLTHIIVIIIITALLTFIFTSYYYQQSVWQERFYKWSNPSKKPQQANFLSQVKDLLHKTTEKYEQDTSPYTVSDTISSPPPTTFLSDQEQTKKDKKKKSRVNEARCRQILEKIFRKEFPKQRPVWLKNYTGRNLEIDCYNEELNLGLEYHGKQHYIWPNSWMETEEDFKKQQQRDKRKIKLCKEHGIDLIIVPYTVHYDDLYTFIIEELERLERIEIED
jgi:hypothetical protein